MFVRAPWGELCIATGHRDSTEVSIVVSAWSLLRARPTGYQVRRWKYDRDTDTVTMELEHKPKVIGRLRRLL